MFSSRFKWKLESNRLAQLLERKRRAPAPVLDLTESNPTRAGLTYPAPEILAALTRPEALLYEPAPRGLSLAREAVAGYYRERGLAVDHDRLHLTASTSESYSYLFKLLADQGDAVLVPQPSYPLFEFLAALEGVELRPYGLSYIHPGGWSIDFDSVAGALDSTVRAIIVVNPNNPTGSFIKRAELERLNELCSRHRLALIIDEVFGDYALDRDLERVESLVLNDSALTFVMSGLSKILALPQMKLGWIVTGGPAELRDQARDRLDLIADTYLSVSAPIQHAAPGWLELRAGLNRQILDRARGNLEWLARATANTPSRLLRVEGGWSATLEIPRHFSEEEWVLMLLERDDVLAHPGYYFDFQREAFIVLSLLPRPEIFVEAASRLLARVHSI
ncbi:MAG TPA: pyridoxal phosphate-dependent aminotransferase [Blastocatellia bacterium]|nr:pyridoxal phosphate-dependent aminotransferase [Blastocatellia bacterium]